MSQRYDLARDAFERLERIAELVDQVGLDASRIDLMQNPTKGMAAAMYERGIDSWFAEHGIHDAPEDIVDRYYT